MRYLIIASLSFFSFLIGCEKSEEDLIREEKAKIKAGLEIQDSIRSVNRIREKIAFCFEALTQWEQANSNYYILNAEQASNVDELDFSTYSPGINYTVNTFECEVNKDSGKVTAKITLEDTSLLSNRSVNFDESLLFDFTKIGKIKLN